ncbi:hypothetical protein ACSLN1_26360, partial [Escherichia coli]
MPKNSDSLFESKGTLVKQSTSPMAVKDLIREVQNITCDFVLKSYDETVLAVIQFGETATVRQQKK